MENEIKKHIDKLRKTEIKNALHALPNESTDEEKSKLKKQIERSFQYYHWLKRTLSFTEKDSHFSTSSKIIQQYELLTLEVAYKQTFKIICDLNHPLGSLLLLDLDLTETQVTECIDIAKHLNSEALDFYLLFKDELLEDGLALNNIQSKIDQLAKDSSQGTIVSHAVKMSNPACKYPKLYSVGTFQADGLIKTGNTSVDFDMHINATKLKVFKFLSLKYKGDTFLNHIENNNIKAFTKIFSVSDEHANSWVKLFALCLNTQDLRTNKLVKQTYFPIENNYHLLSLLQPSGLVFAFKEKIEFINDRSPTAYIGKKSKKDNKFYELGFSSISNLTVTKHGGDHPKNISGLNNKFQSYYLLNSVPPKIEIRNIHFPKTNFFTESFRYRDYHDVLQAFHKILKTDYNNINIREGRDYRIQELMDRLINKMWAIRSISNDQYYQPTSRLKPHQRIWLCDKFKQEREETDGWLDKLSKEISSWIIRSYEKTFAKQAIKLSKDELLKIKSIVDLNKEALR